MKNTKKMVMCLFNRHPFPGDPAPVFPEVADPCDFAGLYKTANSSIPEGVEELAVYVTGLTSAMLAVVEVCLDRGITLEARHYNAATGSYASQYPVGYFSTCPFCGHRMRDSDYSCPSCGG
jgi:hypothetical protein